MKNKTVRMSNIWKREEPEKSNRSSLMTEFKRSFQI